MPASEDRADGDVAYRDAMRTAETVAQWAALGRHRQLAGASIFTVDAPALGTERFEPLLVLHGFPTASFDFHLVVDELRQDRRVLLVDMLGYGLSDKPDRAYTIGMQADVVAAFTDELGIGALSLLTHDLGDTVGGELLARQVEGRWAPQIVRRVLTNGSVYIELAHLSAGQQLLLSLPDERLAAEGVVDEAGVTAGLRATFSPRADVDDAELSAMWSLIARQQGERLLPRLIRYIEERRRSEGRFTGAIEEHPSPLAIVWGDDDPIAVSPIAERLNGVRPDAELHWLDGVGHYPMVEAPARFADAVLECLADGR